MDIRSRASTPRSPIGFAHRGARAHAPENTLSAFKLALEMGAGGLESDVWLTADGVAVLDHDGVFGGASVAEVAFSELPAHVPRLEDLYRECGGGFELSLDVKDAAAAPEVLRVAAAAGATQRLWLCHWSWKVVARWRRASTDVRLVDSTRVEHMSTGPAERADRMRRLGIDALNLHHRDWTPEWLDAMHGQDRLAFAWDLQEPDDLARILALGTDGIYSDWVDRMQGALASSSRDSAGERHR